MINIFQKLLPTKPKVGEVTFIVIDGHGASGKSTLAKLLSKELDAEIIHVDDFSGPDNLINWHKNIIEKVLEPIKNGTGSLSYKPASWWENHHPDLVTNQSVTKIMILEGVGALRKELNDYISFSIFVDTPKDICIQRGVERDLSTGKSVKEITSLWEEWMNKEDEYMKSDNPKLKADMVIDGMKPFEEQMNFNK